MEFSTSVLALTKLQVPALRERTLSRRRLLDFLDGANRCQLLLICAPAGYGKTTLLAEWAHSLINKETSVAWYALDPGDDDPIPFRAYFIASLQQALGPLPELAQLSKFIRSKPDVELKYILTAAINIIQSCHQKCLLILDDYHLISSPEIHATLAYLIEHLPENLQVVLSSRADPPMPLARFRARGQLSEMRIADLRFTEEESAIFLNNLLQLDLSFQDIQVLEQRTEGWITGLQLAALSLAGRQDKSQLVASFSGSHRYLMDYLMEEVVSRQPAEIQVFLASTCILDRLCAPLCEHLLLSNKQKNENLTAATRAGVSPSNAQAVMESLETANLFLVALDEDRIWFRYHQLFREFLLARLKRNQPEIISALHQSACEWFAKQSLVREAAIHAFQADDWEYAAAFLEEHSFALITHSDLSSIYEWSSKIPEEVMQRHPILCLQQALSMAYGLRRNNQLKIKARLHQVDQILANTKDLELAGSLMDLAGIIRTFMAFTPDPRANPQELLSLSETMIANNPQGDAGQFSGFLLRGYAQMALMDTAAAGQTLESARQIALRACLYFGIVESAFQLARLVQSQGQLKRAAEICLQNQEEIASLLPQSEKELPAVGSLDVVLGCILLEQNELESAERSLRRGRELMGGGMSPYYQMPACLALSRLCEITGRHEESQKYLDELDAAWPDASFYTAGLRVMRLLLATPKSPAVVEKVQAWCEETAALFTDGSAISGIGPFGAADLYDLARLLWIRAQIATGKGAQVRPYLQQQLNQARTHGLLQRVIELSLLDALVCDARGDFVNVLTSMEQALELAQREGYLRFFDQFPALNHLLEKIAEQSKYKGYIQQILAAIASPTGAEQAHGYQAFFGQSLSEREMEVLQMIARGATNQEIANTLVVTVGTVKSHVNHILRKLDSHNRTEAVAKARSLGLLET